MGDEDAGEVEVYRCLDTLQPAVVGQTVMILMAATLAILILGQVTELPTWLVLTFYALGLLAGLVPGGRATNRRGWRIDADGLWELYRFGRPLLHRWDELEHVVIDPEGARVLKLSGEVRIARNVLYWRELVDRLERELWQRHGRHVPRVRDVPTAAISRAGTGEESSDARRGLSRPDR